MAKKRQKKKKFEKILRHEMNNVAEKWLFDTLIHSVLKGEDALNTFLEHKISDKTKLLTHIRVVNTRNKFSVFQTFQS